jgi:hypothetical protein
MYIETTLEDIAEANQLMKHILLKKMRWATPPVIILNP